MAINFNQKYNYNILDITFSREKLKVSNTPVVFNLGDTNDRFGGHQK